MKDRWSELARRARQARVPEPEIPFGFEAAVLRRLERTPRDSFEPWLPVLRPAVGVAFATALVCVMLQARGQSEVPANLLVDTENLIQLAVLK